MSSAPALRCPALCGRCSSRGALPAGYWPDSVYHYSGYWSDRGPGPPTPAAGVGRRLCRAEPGDMCWISRDAAKIQQIECECVLCVSERRGVNSARFRDVPLTAHLPGRGPDRRVLTPPAAVMAGETLQQICAAPARRALVTERRPDPALSPPRSSHCTNAFVLSKTFQSFTVR